jgi:GTP-binding protein HflX
LYVADASDPTFRAQLDVTKTVLREIGAGDAPSLLLLNKADRLSESEQEALTVEFPEAILLSAKLPDDVAALRERILAFFDTSMIEAEILVPYDRQGSLGEVYENARVLSEEYGDDGARLMVRADPAAVARLKALFAK